MTTAAESRPRKPKKCQNAECRAEFVPQRMGQKACSPACAQAMVQTSRAKAERRAQRADTKARKEKIKPRSQWMKEAQAAFNSFIRKRDEHLPCICCGKWGADEGWKPGGSWDAGHFLGVGAYPELRFIEDNCHKQLKSCNAGSAKYARKGRTVAQEYRERLIQKIGIERVEFLEGPHEPKHYSIEDLKQIKATYTAKRKEIEQC